MMPEAVFCILMAYVQALPDCEPDQYQIAEYSGFSPIYVTYLTIPTVGAGLLARVSGGRASLTEHGKIALAIEVGRRTRRRARGDRAASISLASFIRLFGCASQKRERALKGGRSNAENADRYALDHRNHAVHLRADQGR